MPLEVLLGKPPACTFGEPVRQSRATIVDPSTLELKDSVKRVLTARP